MKNLNVKALLAFLFAGILIFTWSCDPDPEPTPDPGESTTELLAKKFSSAPVLDGEVEDMWNECQTLVGTAVVPDAGSRGNADFNGDGSPGPVGVFDPYTGESNDFKLRAGTFGNEIFFLLEWDDAEDSKDRESWYFDTDDNRWKMQHKYANNDNDKFYEDKFAFLWEATEVAGFANNTCYATCHQGLTVTSPSQKAARHYTNSPGEIVDMWHWKRVRSTYEPTTVDDQQMIYKEHTGDAGQNGRTGDEGSAGYHTNKQTLALDGTGDDVKVPMYIIPGKSEYYWITKDEIADGTAKLITGVASDGTLTYDGGSINPADGGYENGVGNMRFPSVWVESFTGSRGDIAVSAVYTGTGWITEFSRKLDTGNSDDVKFDVTKEFPFGLAIFNNSAIAHEIKNNLLLKFE
ncbi:MAG: hypothetical protein DWQ02_10560 [Bacteroidetes bacterium]|nr:MAG: hypothetical protein DWQ02_10560 [Bacteroidota bacterium]